ncbi:alpha/beta hydrolase family protein [Acidovorax sp. NPDC077693]|uniref:alpha/beta hydrolase family protein n=1 Tax=unclassified Acidovorax TaxID=2684926 RepID=UPI0037CBF78E
MRSSCLATAALLALGSLGATAHAAEPAPLDCLGPVQHEAPAPGSPEWQQRDADNMACARQRIDDFAQQPAALFTPGKTPALDAYRNPASHANTRFRYTEASTPSASGKPIAVEIYRPCAAGTCTGMPAGLKTFEPPYPAVVIVHGGYSSKRLHRSAAQVLAEAGYMTIALETTAPMGTHGPDAQSVVDWVFATPKAPLAGDATPFFPHWDQLDVRMVGIAGHSQGGSTASLIGQADKRISAIVAWDNLTALKTGWVDKIGMDPPADLALRTPALGLGADYYFKVVPTTEPPEPAKANTQGGRGRGGEPHPKDPGYQELKSAGVDTMLVVLRAGTHLDFSLFGGPASRYGESVVNYYTLAWFDRYLKGAHDPALAADAFRRLTAPTFDDSADRHNISQGLYDKTVAGDSVLKGNRPYLVGGTPVRDRLSFYYQSRCAITQPGRSVRVASEDMRATGCR